MTEYRIARPEDREAYIELANYVFSHAYNPHDFEAIVPKVYGEGIASSSMQRIAIDERGSVRALIACMPNTAHVAGYALRMGFIGTVSVHPKARGEGHMKRLMNDWMAEMRETCDFAMLGGQRQRYEYFGFTRGGTIMNYTVAPVNLRHALAEVDASGISFRPLFDTEGAEAYAAALNAARPAYMARDMCSQAEILITFRQKPLAIMDGEKRIGYLVTNKEGNSVSEIALENAGDIARTAKAYVLRTGGRVTFTAPECDAPLNACLCGFAEEHITEPSAMYNIYDFANVLQAYLTLKQRTVGLSSGVFSAVLDGQPITARVDDNGVTVERVAQPGAPSLNKMQAQTLLLTPYGRYLGMAAPADWFPLPMHSYTADDF